MFDEIFEGTPREKCFEIIFGANPSVVSVELEKIFDELATLRALVNNSNINKNDILSTINTDELETYKDDLYITLVSDILSQNE